MGMFQRTGTQGFIQLVMVWQVSVVFKERGMTLPTGTVVCLDCVWVSR